MEDLTLKELESLANDYFDCKLSRQEETALREVLLMSPLRSDTIDACRLEMGLEAFMKQDGRRRRLSPPVPRRRFATFRWVSVAASAAVLLSLCIGLLGNGFGQGSQTDIYAEVYINGRPVTDRAQAREYAERQRREALATMNDFMEASADSLRVCLQELGQPDFR